MECRICELCGHPNPPDRLECERDGADLSYVFPVQWPNTTDSLGDALTVGHQPGGSTEKPTSGLTIYADGLHTVLTADAVFGRSGNIEPLYFAEKKYVSNKHAKVLYQSPTWMLQDLGSTNGTFLNDVKLRPGDTYALSSGDVVKLADVTLHILVTGDEVTQT